MFKQISQNFIAFERGFYETFFKKPFPIVLFLLFILPFRLSYAFTVLVNPPLEPGLYGVYVGSEQCRRCHPKQWAVWSIGKHSSAYGILPEKDRNNPSCLRCHVTGLGRFSGYVSAEKTPDLRGVQCESCHGEGSKHISSTMEKKRQTITGVKTNCDCEVRVVCMGCHNKKHSPDFDYESFWKKVEH